jgi:hypothetical protein
MNLAGDQEAELIDMVLPTLNPGWREGAEASFEESFLIAQVLQNLSYRLRPGMS